MSLLSPKEPQKSLKGTNNVIKLPYLFFDVFDTHFLFLGCFIYLY